MTIRTDFVCGDKVWIWKNNTVIETVIDRIKVDINLAFIVVSFHVQTDESDYFRYEEDLFKSKEECIEAMKAETIKLNHTTLKKNNLIKCIKNFTSFEGDKFTVDWTFCVIKVCKRNLIVRGNGEKSTMEYYLLTSEEVSNNFELYKAKWSGPKINNALKISNIEE